MPKTKEELEKLKEDYKKLAEQTKELSDEELENVSGGCTTYGDGYDGKNRPIVTTMNSCDRYQRAKRFAEGNFEVCDTCFYYSSNDVDNPKRISLVSAWCLHPERIDN